MKYLLFALTFCFTLSCASDKVKNSTPTVTSKGEVVLSGVVDVPTFAKLMEEDHLLLDVRTPEEFSEGYIANAVNINFYDEDFAERAAALDKSKPLLVYCKKGGRSAKAINIIKEAGFEKMYDLEGGFTAWQKAAQPIAK